MQITVEMLNDFEILSGLSEEEKTQLIPLLKIENFTQGTLIFNEKDPGNKLYFIHRGTVQLEKEVTNEDTTRIARLDKGEIMGEISMLDKSVRSATATAYTDVHFLVLTYSQLDNIAKSHPRLYATIFKGIACVLASRLRGADEEITQLSKQLYFF